jgi:hypothetical protein
MSSLSLVRLDRKNDKVDLAMGEFAGIGASPAYPARFVGANSLRVSLPWLDFCPMEKLSFPFILTRYSDSTLITSHNLQVMAKQHMLTLLSSDYDVMLSRLSDFQAEMARAGLSDKVVYLDRGDEFKFQVKRSG